MIRSSSSGGSRCAMVVEMVRVRGASAGGSRMILRQIPQPADSSLARACPSLINTLTLSSFMAIDVRRMAAMTALFAVILYFSSSLYASKPSPTLLGSLASRSLVFPGQRLPIRRTPSLPILTKFMCTLQTSATTCMYARCQNPTLVLVSLLSP